MAARFAERAYFARTTLASAFIVLVASGIACDGSAPADSDLQASRRRMVVLLEQKGIDDRRVLDAMAVVPRHVFVDPAHAANAYEDRAAPIAEGQTTWQPSHVAWMLSLLDLDPAHRVLEIGTGTGYQTALLSRLVGEIWSIEIRDTLREKAQAILEKLGAVGVISMARVKLLTGDGKKGHPDAAPFDRIIVTSASTEVPPALIEQLVPGGLLIIPIGHRVQRLELVRKQADGSIVTESHDAGLRFSHLEE